MIQLILQILGIASLAFTGLFLLSMLAWRELSLKLFRSRRVNNREVALGRVHEVSRPPGVSIVMPAYNEELMIVDTVTSALQQSYPNLEVIVVNDGSKDGTVDVLKKAFDLVEYDWSGQSAELKTMRFKGVYRSESDPRFLLVDKEPAGSKADGANAGINVARFPWVVVMDSDEFMADGAMARCMAEVIDAPDEVAAVGTTLFPANDIVLDGQDIVDVSVSKNYWVGCQLVEYMMAFMVSRPGLAQLNSLPIVSGGFGLFKRSAILEVGGFKENHLGEDMDLCLNIHRQLRESGKEYKIVQVPEAVVWTEFPSTYRVLSRQRIRWHRGLKAIMGDHADMIGKRRFGAFGLLGVGSLYIFEWWGPILEAVGWVSIVLLLSFGWMNPTTLFAIWIISQLVGMVTTLIGVGVGLSRLNVYTKFSDMMRLFGWVVAMNWGYRQITLFWRIRSLLPGATGWGEMTRTGIKTVGSPA